MKKRGVSHPELIPTTSPEYSSRAAAVIGAGGIAAIPTETSYGLAVDPFNTDALRRLFAIKQRPLAKPVLVLVDSMKSLARMTPEIPPVYQSLIKQYWPGPVTLIFAAREELPHLLTAGTGTVGARMSSNPVAAEICRCAGGCITATSANISGSVSARSTADIVDYFGDQIDIIVDGGELEESPGSSIFANDRDALFCIREGVIPFTSVLKVAANKS